MDWEIGGSRGRFALKTPRIRLPFSQRDRIHCSVQHIASLRQNIRWLNQSRPMRIDPLCRLTLTKRENKTDLQRTDLAKEKTGVFTGAYAINPANKKAIPIWVADYVLMGYGTGVIMAVPAEDDRDWNSLKHLICQSFARCSHRVISGTNPTSATAPRLTAVS